MGMDSEECIPKNSYSYFSTKAYVAGTQKDRLNETVLLSNPKHMLKLMGQKISTILCSIPRQVGVMKFLRHWCGNGQTQVFSLECIPKNYYYYFSTKTYVVGTQKNRHNETVSFEHPKHMLNLMGKK